MGTGLKGELPPVPGFQAGDYAGSAYAVMAILAALYQRRDTGEGRYLDISMFDSLFSMSNVDRRPCAGAVRWISRLRQYGALWRQSAVRDISNQGRQSRRGLVARSTDLEFVLQADRSLRSDFMPTKVRNTVTRRTEPGPSFIGMRSASSACPRIRDELVRWMAERNVPILPVYTSDEAVNSEHVAARGMVEWISHPSEGRIPIIANPLHASGLTRERSPAPSLGQHQEIVERAAAAFASETI